MSRVGRWLVVGIGALAPGCREVRVEDRSDVDASAVGSGGGGGEVGGATSSHGSGGSGASSGASGSGAAPPVPPETVACADVAWGTPSDVVLGDGLRSFSAHLAFAEPLPGDDLLVVLGASRDGETPPAMAEAYLRRGDVMDVAPRPSRSSMLDLAPPITFRDGSPIVLHVDEDLGPRLVDLADAGEASLAVPVSEDLGRAHALAWSASAARFAVVHGWPTAPELTLVDDAGGSTRVGTLACADRRASVAVVPLGDGFLIAHDARAGLGPCNGSDGGASTTLQLDVITPGGDVRSTTQLALDGPVGDLRLAPRAGSAAWLAVRAEGADQLRVIRLDVDGSLGASTLVPMSPGRATAIAARGDGIALLDVGPAVGGEPVARLRILDAALGVVTVGDMPLVNALVPEGHPALHVSPDGAVLAGGWIGRAGDGGTRLVVAPAGCE